MNTDDTLTFGDKEIALVQLHSGLQLMGMNAARLETAAGKLDNTELVAALAAVRADVAKARAVLDAMERMDADTVSGARRAM